MRNPHEIADRQLEALAVALGISMECADRLEEDLEELRDKLKLIYVDPPYGVTEEFERQAAIRRLEEERGE